MLPFLPSCGIQTLHNCSLVSFQHTSESRQLLFSFQRQEIGVQRRCVTSRSPKKTFLEGQAKPWLPQLLHYCPSPLEIHIFEKETQITQGSPSPAQTGHWTGVTLPRRPRREPEWWIRHCLSLGWQSPGWHQWVLEEAEPVGGVFLERAACSGESSHALRHRSFSEHHVSGRWQRQTACSSQNMSGSVSLTRDRKGQLQ